MSQIVLRAILHLFAIVAHEDGVTEDERESVLRFLQHRLDKNGVSENISIFDEYVKNLSGDASVNIKRLCNTLNKEVTQKQKVIIFLETMVVVLADGIISKKEDYFVKLIGTQLNISDEDINLIIKYIQGDFNSQQILLIDANSEKDENKYNQPHIYRKNIPCTIAILRLDSSDLYFFKYYGKNAIYINGVAQKPDKITPLTYGSSICWTGLQGRLEKNQAVYFSELLSHFIPESNKSRLVLEAQNISMQFEEGKYGIRNVSLCEESGNMIALMGGSGSGKSTLLHVLNGTDRPTSGKVIINGIDVHQNLEKFKGIFGFVPQEDHLIEELTVYENLYFAAKLCFDQFSEEQIDELVNKQLLILGLLETKNLKVGSSLAKTISGGQRKRLNIGLELLREPSILFVDEPTSGLSSKDSEKIIELLKDLALKGKLVFAVIHQPSSDIFKLFDKLLILDLGGFPIYFGNPVDAVTYFKENINHINSDQSECPQCGNINPEQIFNIIETMIVDEYGNITEKRKVSPENWNAIFNEKISKKAVPPSEDKIPSALQLPSWLKQIKLFGYRDILSKISNKQYIAINLLEAPLLAFLLSTITYFYDIHDTADYVFIKNPNLPAYLFMSVIVALFMGLTLSAEEIIRDQKLLKREFFLNLGRSSYLVAKITVLFSISAVQTLIYVWVGNHILHIEGMFFIHWSIMFTASCFANLLGLNISSGFNHAVTIYILIPILLIPQLILSGIVVKFDKMNPILGKDNSVPLVGNMMTSRWAYEAAMVSQFKDNEYEKEYFELDKKISEYEYKGQNLVPTLQSKLEFVQQNINNGDTAKNAVSKSLDLLHDEIEVILAEIGQQNFPEFSKLRINTYDSALFNKTKQFLHTLKIYYSNKLKKATNEYDKQVLEIVKEKGENGYKKLRETNENIAISAMVKNLGEGNYIGEMDGRLVQKINPIFQNSSEDDILGFEAPFFIAEKNLFGKKISTYCYNIGVIWIMTIFLYITLYYNLLKRALLLFERNNSMIRR